MIGAFLGLKDLRREPAIFACFAIALAAVLGPLLVLFGLKFGIVTTLLSELRSNPRNLEIAFRGNYSLKAADIARIRALPGVSFLVPATRTIAARIELSGVGENDRGLNRATVLPTGPGDPLLPKNFAPLGAGEIALSARLAQRLRVGVGGQLVGGNVRHLASGPEQLEIPFTVVHVFARGVLEGDRALLAVATLDELEAFFDGYELPSYGLTGKPLSERVNEYETLRMYARRIEDVAGLDVALTALGFRVVSRADEVRGILKLDANLAAAFAILALVGGVGYLISLAVSLWANVERKRQPLSVFRLLGASGLQLVAFPLAQAVVIAAAGTALAIAVFIGVAFAVNNLLGGTVGTNGQICVLEWRHFAFAVGLTMVSALVAAAAGGARMIYLQPSEALRDV